ncbi:MAG TPA: DNA polymerase III subunit delta' [Gammaproteobacteria bacterium]|nr:DNA polymerase III subunit delta' [Gammaproteobacteria bacterium]
MIAPWLQSAWQRVWQQCKEGRLPHALMLSGINGLGKLAFAKQLNNALLCQAVSDAGEPCGQCHDCRLFAGEVHPNSLIVVPEKAGQAIKVDQVRDANAFVAESSFKGKTRIVIFEPADQLNLNAANALLKTLEEPASDAVIILVCHQMGTLPATIRSRCQQLHFTAPATEQSLAWLSYQNISSSIPLAVLLNLAGGAPYQALRLASDEHLPVREAFYNAWVSLAKREGDAIAYAQTFQKEELSLLLNLSLSFLTDLMRAKVSLGEAALTNLDRANDVTQLMSKTNLPLLTTFMAQCTRWQKQIYLGFTLNKNLMLETLFYRWMECTA